MNNILNLPVVINSGLLSIINVWRNHINTHISELFAGLWQDYLRITPSAHKIHALLANKNNATSIVNDHIALRTFDIDKVSLKKLAAHFLAMGYEHKGDYDFVAKKLTAQHFEHPDPTVPKVFISELRVNELSEEAQKIIHSLVDQIDENVITENTFLYSGIHWEVSSEDYKRLLVESEYAAWMLAWGYRANHFTVNVNHLSTINELTDVNNLLKDAGFTLNSSGGEIKGGENVFLAQSSTMADRMEVKFSNETLIIPSCFYEFAQRYEMADGNLYQGFVATSADKIFESTNVS
jgi:hypothetical protein